MRKPQVTIFEAIHQAGLELLQRNCDVKTAYGASRSVIFELTRTSDAIIVKSVVKVDVEGGRHVPLALASRLAPLQIRGGEEGEEGEEESVEIAGEGSEDEWETLEEEGEGGGELHGAPLQAAGTGSL